jgi:hypothetical protein
MSIDVWSFNWVSIGPARDFCRRTRIYEAAIPIDLRSSAANYLISPIVPQTRMNFQRGFGNVSIAIDQRNRQTFRLDSSHTLGNSDELLQLTFVQCFGGAALNGDPDWGTFLKDAESLVGPDGARRLSRLRRIPSGAVAFTVRSFEGVMPDVEIVHQAFAASIFHNRCSQSLTSPEWAQE